MSLELEFEEILSTDPLWNNLIESKILNGIKEKPKELLYVEIYCYIRSLVVGGDLNQANICKTFLDDEFDDFFEMNEDLFKQIREFIK